MEGTVLEAPGDQPVEGPPEGAPQELPSILAITNRHVIGGVDVSVPAEDGSRAVKLISVNGQVVIDLDLAPNVCEMLATNLTAVEIIKEEDTDAASNAPGTTDGP